MLKDFVKNKLADILTLFLAKSDQYAAGDELANFRTGALLEYNSDKPCYMYEVAKEYMNKHVAHVYNNGVDGSKVDESLHDIIVYCLIMLYLRSLHRGQGHEQHT